MNTLRRSLIPIALSLLAPLLSAGEPVVPPAGPLAPQGIESPLIPQAGPDPGPAKNESSRMIDIEAQMAVIDQRIGDLLQEHQGRLPAIHLRFKQELSTEREARDLAWQRLQAVMNAPRATERAGDTLDSATAGPDDPLWRELRAENLLAVVLCHRDRLVTSADRTITNPAFVAGLTALEQAVAVGAQLPIGSRPILARVRVFFAAERARRTTDPAQAEVALTEARNRLAELERDHPGSPQLIEEARQDINAALTERRLQQPTGQATP